MKAHATYDGQRAATSLLALGSTDIDEVLLASRSGRGCKDWSQHM